MSRRDGEIPNTHEERAPSAATPSESQDVLGQAGADCEQQAVTDGSIPAKASNSLLHGGSAASTWRDALALWWYRRKVAKQALRLHERTRHLRCVARTHSREDIAAEVAARDAAKEASTLSPEEALQEGLQMGMDWAVDMARDGNLRLAALPFEKGDRPRHRPIRPWKLTRLAWASWWRERMNRG